MNLNSREYLYPEKRVKRLLLILSGLIVWQLYAGELHAQTVTLSASGTPSNCSNDGAITANASGGTGPYTYSLTSGPAGITYPFTLPTGNNVFANLSSGTYTVKVTDANGSIGTATGVVGGSYQYPALTITSVTSPPEIIGNVSGGTAPYQYALSTTGANTGFGAYQSSDVFAHICPGQYWIRVRDNCGNIYTTSTNFSYSITCTVNCANFSKGTLNVSATGGHAPYTYTIGSTSNTNGIFAGLPSYFSGTMTVTDSCGVSCTKSLSSPTLLLTENCPFDSTLYSIPNAYITPNNLTYLCSNCTPPQTTTLSTGGGSHPVFTNISRGRSYNIIILSSSCGVDTIRSQITPPPTNNVILHINYTSCNSFSITTSSTTGMPVVIDSFVLSYIQHGPDIQKNTTGIFHDIMDSSYIVTAYPHGGCSNIPYTSVHLPVFQIVCYNPMMDSSCSLSWELTTLPHGNEMYSLISPHGDTMPASLSNGYWNFYNINPHDSNTIISDSGCALKLNPVPMTYYQTSISSYVPCGGQPVIDYEFTNSYFCNVPIELRLIHNSSLVADQTLTSSAQVTVSDTGWYTYRAYFVADDTFAALRYDSLCPIDSGRVYVTDSHVPQPYSSISFMCDSTVTPSIPYTIYGGFAPYTIQIPGYDTITLRTNSGIFPTTHPGSYTMIVFDSCGISRSVTFSIVDTCSGCAQAVISASDTAYCSSDTIHLSSIGTNAAYCQWLINGQFYSSDSAISFTPISGTYDILLRVTSLWGCKDSSLIHIGPAVLQPIDIGQDTVYCDAFIRVLSTGVASTIWSTGVTGPQITIDSAGTYWALDSETCGNVGDTIVIVRKIKPLVYLGPDTTICAGYELILDAGNAGAIYQWQDHSSRETYTVSVAGVYDVSVTDNGCMAADSVIISYISPPALFSLGVDTTYCGDFIRVLSTGVPATFWSTGVTAAQIMVDTAGKYWAEDSNICGIATDSITLYENPIPVVDLGNDTTLCTGAILMLDAGNVGSSYLWQDHTTAQIYTVSVQGIYAVGVTSRGCTGSDSIQVSYISAPSVFSLGENKTLCDDQSVTLDASQPNTFYRWSNGATTDTITVNLTNTYAVLDSNACGTASDSIMLTFESCVCRVNIPTGFSPNDDGKNDELGIVTVCAIENFQMEVYYRWGVRVFQTTSVSDRWDGTYKGRNQPIGVYIYRLKYTDPFTNKVNNVSGNVTLLR